MSEDKKDDHNPLPMYTILSRKRLHNGRRVHIVTPEEWTFYVYEFNKAKGLEQPKQLVKDRRMFRRE